MLKNKPKASPWKRPKPPTIQELRESIREKVQKERKKLV